MQSDTKKSNSEDHCPFLEEMDIFQSRTTGNDSNDEETHLSLEEMDQFWSRIMSKSSCIRKYTEMWLPAIDIIEKEDRLIVLIELPGMNEQDFEVSLTGCLLKIKGEKKYKHEESDGYRSRREMYFGPFERTCVLPVDMYGDQIDKVYEHGILYLTIFKKNQNTETDIDKQIIGGGG